MVILSALPHKAGLSCVTPQLERQALSLGSKTNCSEAWLHGLLKTWLVLPCPCASLPGDLEVGVILVPRSHSVWFNIFIGVGGSEHLSMHTINVNVISWGNTDVRCSLLWYFYSLRPLNQRSLFPRLERTHLTERKRKPHVALQVKHSANRTHAVLSCVELGRRGSQGRRPKLTETLLFSILESEEAGYLKTRLAHHCYVSWKWPPPFSRDGGL